MDSTLNELSQLVKDFVPLVMTTPLSTLLSKNDDRRSP
jgi:hypothetical protein